MSTPAALDGQIYSGPRAKEYTLDQNNLERTCSLDNGRHQVHSDGNLGDLECLPLELISNILLWTDLQSLTDFRRINKRAMEIIDSIPQYRIIVEHAPSVLRGILSIGSGRNFSCDDLYRTLAKPDCEICGDFSGYIYIITCRRVCTICSDDNPEFYPLLIPEVKRFFGLDFSHTQDLPKIRSILGVYAPNQFKCRDRRTLVDPVAARAAGIAFHGSAETMQQHAEAANRTELDTYEARVKRSQASKTGPVPRQPLDITDPHPLKQWARCYMGMVRAPWVSITNLSPDWGFNCLGCEKHQKRPLHWERKYTSSTFAAHVEECGPIKNGVHCPPENVSEHVRSELSAH